MTSLRSAKLAIGALALGLVAGWNAPAAAQTATEPQGETQMQQEAEPLRLTDDDLRSYAMAAVQVRRISEAYQPRMEAAESAQQQEELRNQAMEEMVQAVEKEGLTVLKYNQISSVSQTDPEIASRIEKHIEAAQ